MRPTHSKRPFNELKVNWVGDLNYIWKIPLPLPHNVIYSHEWDPTIFTHPVHSQRKGILQVCTPEVGISRATLESRLPQELMYNGGGKVLWGVRGGLLTAEFSEGTARKSSQRGWFLTDLKRQLTQKKNENQKNHFSKLYSFLIWAYDTCILTTSFRF